MAEIAHLSFWFTKLDSGADVIEFDVWSWKGNKKEGNHGMAKLSYLKNNLNIEPEQWCIQEAQRYFPNQEIDYRLDQPTIELTTTYKELFETRGGLKDRYIEGECELAAKEFQKVWGGNLVFVAPYNTKDNSWFMCDYCGHWANRIYYKGKTLWVDYSTVNISDNKDKFTSIMQYIESGKFYQQPMDVKLFVYGEDGMPYQIIWHY